MNLSRQSWGKAVVGFLMLVFVLLGFVMLVSLAVPTSVLEPSGK